MKKRTKIILTVCGTAFILFLLLPFLDSSSHQSAAQKEAAKAEPQIFTSNPLTDLVGRIARIFRSRTNQSAEPGAQNEEMMGMPASQTLYASAPNAAGNPADTTASADESAYLNAYLQNDDGEWVLIRQTAPEGSSHGMHEINVKENAYDRYVAQERQARFTPVMRQRTQQEVPDSKLARVFNPIKRLFGAGEKPAAKSHADSSTYTASARRTSSSSDLDKNKEKSSILQQRRPMDWTEFKNNPYTGMKPGSKDATEAFLDLINPVRSLRETAQWLADIKYPNATTPEEQQAKEDLQEQDKVQLRQEIQAMLIEQNADKEPVNVFQDMTNPFSCGDGSVQKKTDACSLAQEKNIAAIRADTAAQFFEQTGLHLPPAGITVVLNASEMPILSEQAQQYMQDEAMQAFLTEEKQNTLKFYEFMQTKCTDNCYWVSTGGNNSSELAETVEAVGLTLKGDPLRRYNQYAQAFLEEQRQNDVPQETLEQLEKQLMENKTPYITYTQEEIEQLLQQTSDMLEQRANPKDASVPLFTHAENAYNFYQRTNTTHPLLYGNGEIVNGEKDLNERASAFTGELAQFINNIQDIKKKRKKDHAEEGAKIMAAPAIQQVQEQLKKELEQFDKKNDLGTYQK